MEEQEKQQLEQRLEIDGVSVDWYLQRLVSMVNRAPIEMGISLVANGALVSGTLISGKQYFETFAREISQAWPGDDEAKESIRSAFASNAEMYEADTEEENLPLPQYIHLKNATVRTPNGPIPAQGGMLWRGKLNAISGFSLGSIG